MDLLDFIQEYVRKRGCAPTPQEIRDMADFRQAGGIGRLCVALSRNAENYKARMDAAKARAS